MCFSYLIAYIFTFHIGIKKPIAATKGDAIGLLSNRYPESRPAIDRITPFVMSALSSFSRFSSRSNAKRASYSLSSQAFLPVFCVESAFNVGFLPSRILTVTGTLYFDEIANS